MALRRVVVCFAIQIGCERNIRAISSVALWHPELNEPERVEKFKDCTICMLCDIVRVKGRSIVLNY